MAERQLQPLHACQASKPITLLLAAFTPAAVVCHGPPVAVQEAVECIEGYDHFCLSRFGFSVDNMNGMQVAWWHWTQQASKLQCQVKTA